MTPVKEAYKELNRIKRVMVDRAMTDQECSFDNTCIQIVHCEGTRLFYHYAWAVKYKEWWLIFTEHHGNMVHHEDDVVIRAYKQVPVECDKLLWEREDYDKS